MEDSIIIGLMVGTGLIFLAVLTYSLAVIFNWMCSDLISRRIHSIKARKSE